MASFLANLAISDRKTSPSVLKFSEHSKRWYCSASSLEDPAALVAIAAL